MKDKKCILGHFHTNSGKKMLEAEHVKIISIEDVKLFRENKRRKKILKRILAHADSLGW